MCRSHAHAPSSAWVIWGRSSFLPRPKNVHLKLITELKVQIVLCPSKVYGSVINPGTDTKSAQEAVVEKWNKACQMLNTNGFSGKKTHGHIFNSRKKKELLAYVPKSEPR